MGLISGIVNGLKGLFSRKKAEKKALVKKNEPVKVSEKTRKQVKKKEQPKAVSAQKKTKNSGVSNELAQEMRSIIKRSKQETKRKIVEINREAENKMADKISRYSDEIVRLGKRIDELTSQVEKQKLEPKQALGGVQIMYKELQNQKGNIDQEVMHTKELINYLEQDFLKRKISEDMFRQKMFEYREKMHLLEMEKKELDNRKQDLSETTQNIPAVPKMSLKKLSTSNIEEILRKQQETLDKLAEKTIKDEKVVPIQTAMRDTVPKPKIDVEEGEETLVKKYAISTEYDKILVLIEEHGSMKFNEIVKQTGMDIRKVEDACELLEEEGQLVVVYTVIGEPKAQSLDFKERQEVEKLKKKKDAKEKVKKK